MGCCICTDAEGGVARIRGWLVREPGARQRQQGARLAMVVFATPMALVMRMREAAYFCRKRMDFFPGKFRLLVLQKKYERR